MKLENACTRAVGGSSVPIALRADHLALVAMQLQTDTGSRDALVLCELDGHGQLRESATFDPSDQRSAIAALERRFLASPQSTPIVHAVAAWSAAFNARDWDGFEHVLAEDLKVVDRRKVAIGYRNDRAELIASVQVGYEMVPDMFLYVVRDHALSEHVACGLLRVGGTAEQGGAIDWEYIAVTAMRPQGHIHLFEEFDPDDVDAAMARFEELS